MGVSKNNGTPKWYHQLNNGTPWVFSNKNKQKISNLMNTTPPTPRKPSRSKLNPPLLPQARRICHCERPLAPKPFFFVLMGSIGFEEKNSRVDLGSKSHRNHSPTKNPLIVFWMKGISQRFSLHPKLRYFKGLFGKICQILKYLGKLV